jgi:hypothetical protein
VENNSPQQRRSLKYIRLAAYLADQPSSLDSIVMRLDEIEGVVGDKLPANARFPSWWRNDEHRMHSRAWLAAGWKVGAMNSPDSTVTFVREKARV